MDYFSMLDADFDVAAAFPVAWLVRLVGAHASDNPETRARLTEIGTDLGAMETISISSASPRQCPVVGRG